MTITRRTLSAGALSLAATGVAAAQTPPAPILLIHGAWHGAWCWNGLTPLLESAGRKVAAIDLTSLGDDRTPVAQATLANDTQRIVAALSKFDRPAVLVGHSFGGMSVSSAAEAAPERIKSLVYLAAFLPANGESALDLSPRNTRSRAGEAMKGVAPDGTIDLDREKALDIFYNGCPPELAKAAGQRLRPQPVAPMATKVALTEGRWGKLPKTYIRCDQDRALTPAFSDWLVGRRSEVTMRTMDTGHSPFLADPQGLAALLLAV